MSDHAAQLPTTDGAEPEPLPWENLGVLSAGVAFRRSLALLLLHPVRFFRRMAVSGGLHEPVSFFAILLTMALLLSLPAALAYVGLTAPSPEKVSPEAYAAATLPARTATVVVVVFPLALVGGSVLMLLLGTLFHAGSRAFGPRNWEGSVSVWLYTLGGMLTPVVGWLALTFAAGLVGYLLGLPWPETRQSASDVVRWVVYISGAAAGALALVILVSGALIGSTQAAQDDAVMGAASGLAGLVLVALVLGAGVWGFARQGMLVGLAFTGIWVLAAAVFALLGAAKSRQAVTPAAPGGASGLQEGGE
jgi:hypothetical protein